MEMQRQGIITARCSIFTVVQNMQGEICEPIKFVQASLQTKRQRRVAEGRDDSITSDDLSEAVELFKVQLSEPQHGITARQRAKLGMTNAGSYNEPPA